MWVCSLQAEFYTGFPANHATTVTSTDPSNRLIRIAHRTKLIVIMTSLQRSAIWTPLLT